MDFDPTSFMQATIEQALDTKRILLPETDFHGVITKLEGKGGTISKGDRAGDPWGGVKATVELQVSDEIKAATGRDKAIVSHLILLDLTKEGRLDMGKGRNVELGRWFDATGLNSLPNKTPAMLEGRPVVVRVRHEVDADDPEKKYERIGGVRRA